MKAFLLSSVFLVTFATEVGACQCAGSLLPCEAYWNASAVFVGTVTFSTTIKTKRGEYETTRRLVRILVDRQLRGVEENEVEVLTGLGDGSESQVLQDPHTFRSHKSITQG